MGTKPDDVLAAVGDGLGSCVGWMRKIEAARDALGDYPGWYPASEAITGIARGEGVGDTTAILSKALSELSPEASVGEVGDFLDAQIENFAARAVANAAAVLGLLAKGLGGGPPPPGRACGDPGGEQPVGEILDGGLGGAE